MRRLSFIICFLCFLFCSSCKKNGSSSQPLVKPTYHLENITAIAPSGANVYYNITYNNNLPVSITEKSNVGNLVRMNLDYLDGQVNAVEIYNTQTDSTGVLFDKFFCYYTTNNLTRVDWYFNNGDSLQPSGHVTYSYSDKGKLTDKYGYSELDNITQVTHIAYTYDDLGNIVRAVEVYLDPNASVPQITFDLAPGNFKNYMLGNDNSLSVYFFWILDPNEFLDGYLDAMFGGTNLPSSATKTIEGGASQNYSFNYSFDDQNNVGQLLLMPNVYNDYNNILYSNMQFTFLYK